MSGINIGGWIQMWEKNATPFHSSDVNMFLKRFYEKWIGDKQNLKIFVPLCGKSVDMRWLLDQGHRVIGLEASSIAVADFMEENNFEHSTEAYASGEVVKTKDGRCVIYKGDLFEFNSDIEGGFDAIWDRGSLVAIGPDQREKYIQLMKSLLAPHGQYLIETYYNDDPTYQGPPFKIDPECLCSLLDGCFTSEVLLEKNNLDPEIARYCGPLSKRKRLITLCIFLVNHNS
ncbi:hypothetical protein CAPTEDRAFT_214771 [Capitella teleta]|uniref:thiopurine S-methyltransferase n=1 Tax=Capitella teleta TaxID=283909 RepID=R7UJ79_CAPTE|nr:hypothetical protein CAPTEDRAFT_214771 [Capitella teleta]|eukprot:ELU03337.1 hypothetical protein CAPTEDRAFT_214771 [Capitella teleta]